MLTMLVIIQDTKSGHRERRSYYFDLIKCKTPAILAIAWEAN